MGSQVGAPDRVLWPGHAPSSSLSPAPPVPPAHCDRSPARGAGEEVAVGVLLSHADGGKT